MSMIRPEMDRPYDTYPNLLGCDLSYGELDDFDVFKRWFRRKFQSVPKSEGQYRGYLGEDEVVVRVFQFVVNPKGIPETRYTLTRRGLQRETFLPGEATPDIDILRGKQVAGVLNRLENGFRF